MNKRDRVAAKKKPASERERVSLVLPTSMKTALVTVAGREVRTLNQQCEVLLRRGLEEMGVAV
ncbi:hypothetical protein ACVCL3_16025 [Rhodanobacter sp. UC4437_H4]|jgi:hypothetical protein